MKTHKCKVRRSTMVNQLTKSIASKMFRILEYLTQTMVKKSWTLKRTRSRDHDKLLKNSNKSCHAVNSSHQPLLKVSINKCQIRRMVGMLAKVAMNSNTTCLCLSRILPRRRSRFRIILDITIHSRVSRAKKNVVHT